MSNGSHIEEPEGGPDREELEPQKHYVYPEPDEGEETFAPVELSTEQVEAMIEERNRYARDNIMLAAAHEMVSPHDADTLRNMARQMQSQAEATPEQAFIFCWWFQYYAEGGTDEPASDEPEAPVEVERAIDTTGFSGGTVIAGTHKPGELIRAFFAELSLVAPAAAAMHREGTYKHYIADAMQGKLEESDELDAELAGECANTLADALNENAPEGFRFGALDGDGADFGWWPAE